jgi:hypothetical protein
MKKKEVFRWAVFCFTVLVLMVPAPCLGWDDGMEVLKYYFKIDTTPRHQGFPDIQYNPIENEFMGFWPSSGKLREDCDPSDDLECTKEFDSIDGRRISPDGEILGDPIQLSPPELGFKAFNRVAYNVFTNEYMIGFTSGASYVAAEIQIARVDSIGGIQFGPTALHPATSDAGHTEMVFNPVRREYLVVYNDRNVFNEYTNNVGFILDEAGIPIKGPFPVGSPDALLIKGGAYYAPRCDYNSTDNTYLCAWEDFRNPGWDLYAPCDIYGTLLDAEGNMLVEIPVMDDAGMPDEGNQRVPVPIYNPDKNEFLVVYKDEPASGPASSEGWIMGRIINADGTLAGPAFLIEDHPRIQHWPAVEYVEEMKKYFMVWNDFRDDGQPPGTPFYLSGDMDIYARWLDDSGRPIEDEILIADSENWQFGPTVNYNPVMKRFLITWMDGNAVDDYGPLTDPDSMGADIANDIRGTLYGAPSFVSGRIVEEGTGSPVEDAWALVIGPALPALKKTNVGGWFNVVRDSQPNGKYLVVVFKLGYSLAMQAVDYTGEPLSDAIEMNKWW